MAETWFCISIAFIRFFVAFLILFPSLLWGIFEAFLFFFIFVKLKVFPSSTEIGVDCEWIVNTEIYYSYKNCHFGRVDSRVTVLNMLGTVNQECWNYKLESALWDELLFQLGKNHSEHNLGGGGIRLKFGSHVFSNSSESKFWIKFSIGLWALEWSNFGQKINGLWLENFKVLGCQKLNFGLHFLVRCNGGVWWAHLYYLKKKKQFASANFKNLCVIIVFYVVKEMGRGPFGLKYSTVWIMMVKTFSIQKDNLIIVKINIIDLKSDQVIHLFILSYVKSH